MALSLRVGALSVVAAAAAGVPLTLFDRGTYPSAVCNDGTSSGYYFQASSTGSNTWIIQQQGGDWCYDETSCKARLNTTLGSSKEWPESWNFAGILAPTNPVLADANVLYAPYCTSDAWIGNEVTSFSFGKFYSMGSAVVEAIVSELINTHGLGKQAGAKVLYSGCSAGARGVLFNLPHVPALLQKLSPTPIAAFGALLDSAEWLDLQPLNTTCPSFASEVQKVWNMINAQDLVNPSCTVAYPGADGWKCLMAQYALPYLRDLQGPDGQPLAFFLHSFQYDAYQLGHDWCLPFGTPPKTQAQVAYAEMFRNSTRGTTATDVINGAAANTAGMLPACFKHCNTESSTWSTLLTNGVSLQDAVSAWFGALGSGPAAASAVSSQASLTSRAIPQFVVDNCTGFNCGSGCPPA